MKLSTTTLVLGVSLAVVAGLFSSTIFGINNSESDIQTSTSATGLMTGHVTTTVTGADGNVKAYRQSDNIIVQTGENCTVGKLFVSGTMSGCGNTADRFTFIAIGNTTTGAVSRASTNLTTGEGVEHNAGGLVRTNATTITPTAADGSNFARVVLSNTFTNTSPNSQAVTQSGLFNAVSSGDLFARQHFSTITMNNGDSLTVQWTINIGGQTALTNPGPS